MKPGQEDIQVKTDDPDTMVQKVHQEQMVGTVWTVILARTVCQAISVILDQLVTRALRVKRVQWVR